MRVNVYSQELTDEVRIVTKTDEQTGEQYLAAQLMLHSSPMLHHHTGIEDDRSAITFWLPKSNSRREQMAQVFDRIAHIFRTQGS